MNLAVSLTVQEVADRLRVSKMTIYRLIHDPDNPLGAVKVRGSYRIPREGFTRYLRSIGAE